MQTVKSRSVFGGIKKVLKFIFEAVYKVLSFLNLQFTLLVLLSGLILYVSGLFTKYPTAKFWFLIAVVLSVVLGLMLTARKVFKLDKKTKKEKKSVVPTESEESAHPVQANETQSVEDESVVKGYADKPRFYNVAQNPNFVMAEYPDRYELFKKTEKGLVKVRTDYKAR